MPELPRQPALLLRPHMRFTESRMAATLFFSLRSVVGAPWPISLADFPGRFEIAQP
jgi:hypothetical protein